MKRSKIKVSKKERNNNYIYISIEYYHKRKLTCTLITLSEKGNWCGPELSAR